MEGRRGFSMDREERARIWRPEKRFSDKFTDEDIERAWRRAYEKVGEFVMPEKVS